MKVSLKKLEHLRYRPTCWCVEVNDDEPILSAVIRSYG